MVQSRKRNSKKSASKRNGKSKTLRKKKSRKNLKKKITGGFFEFLGKSNFYIKNDTEIYNMVKSAHNQEIHDKDGGFKRFVSINGDMVEKAEEKGFPDNLNYILMEGKENKKGQDSMALKDDEIKLLKSFKDRNLSADPTNLIFKDGNIIEKPEEDKNAEREAAEQKAAEREAAEQKAAEQKAAEQAKIIAERTAARQAREAREAREEAAMTPEEREAKEIAEKAKAKEIAESNERMRQKRMSDADRQKKCTKSGKTGADMIVCRNTGH